MKKLIYLGIILMLGSCDAAESESATSNESESAAESESVAESESAIPTVNANVSQVSTIKIGNLEVMTEDLGEMNWHEAKKACADLGDGWRLPTKDELNILYVNKDKIGGFANSLYWSSTENGGNYAWFQHFVYGDQNDFYKSATSYVRAVRAF